MYFFTGNKKEKKNMNENDKRYCQLFDVLNVCPIRTYIVRVNKVVKMQRDMFVDFNITILF